MEPDDFMPFLPEVPEKQSAANTPDMPVSDAAQKLTSSEPKATPLYRTTAPWLAEGKKYSRMPVVKLHEEICDFVDFISPTREEHLARSQVVLRVKDVIDAMFNKKGKKVAKVHVFGSYETRLYLPSSDIDIVVEWDSEKLTDAEARPPLKKLASEIVKSGIAERGRCKALMQARIPLVKFTDRATNFSVDISFNTKGIDGVKYINAQLSQHAALRPLALVLKQFLEQRALNEPYTGGLGSYSLVCMLVSFFQMHPLVQAKLIRPEENLGVLLLDFLELYGRQFNYDCVGISVLRHSYFDKSDRGWQNERRSGILSIEDPQNPENDLCKASFCFATVRQSFGHALSMLCNVLTSASTKHTDSLLACIIGIPEDTLRHRFYVEQTTNV